jgi:hypothetical protein
MHIVSIIWSIFFFIQYKKEKRRLTNNAWTLLNKLIGELGS